MGNLLSNCEVPNQIQTRMTLRKSTKNKYQFGLAKDEDSLIDILYVHKDCFDSPLEDGEVYLLTFEKVS